MNIKISDSAFIYTALIIMCIDLELIIPLFFAVFIHEAGHILAIKIFGGKVSGITVCAGGLKIAYNSTSFTYFQDIICAFSGPMFGVISALAASYLGLTIFSGISLCINVFNLLPIRPLDGGNIFRNIFMIIFDDRTEIYLNIIEKITLTLLFSVSSYVLIAYHKFSLLFITVVLTFCYCKER